MANKSTARRLKSNSLSQIVIVLTVILVLVAAYEISTRNVITALAPTQLFILAGVLGILGLYLKEEK